MGAFGGGQIKQVQEGTIAIGNAATSATGTLDPAVSDTDKCLIFYLGRKVNVDGNAANSVHIQLTNTTTVTATRVGSTDTVTVSWRVVEYY